MKKKLLILFFLILNYFGYSQINEINEIIEDCYINMAYFINDSTIIYLKDSKENNIVICNFKSGNKKFINISKKKTENLAISPDRKFVAFYSLDKKIRLWDIENDSLISEYSLEKNNVPRMLFLPDTSEFIVLSYKQKVLKIFNSYNLKLKRQLKLTDNDFSLLNYLPNRHLISIIRSDKKTTYVKLYDRNSLSLINSFELSEPYVYDIYETKYDNLLLFSSIFSKLFLWNLKENKIERSIFTKDGDIKGVLFFKNGEYFIGFGQDGNLSFWEFDSFIKKSVLNAHNEQITGIVKFEDSNLFLSVGYDKKIKIWKINYWH